MRPGTFSAALAVVVLLAGCGSRPISAPAHDLLLTTSALGGWRVDAQPSTTSYGSLDAARGVVRFDDGSYIDMGVFTFRTASDAHAGYGHARSYVRSSGTVQRDTWAYLGDESLVGWGPGTMVFLWRRNNVVASASGPGSDKVWIVVSEQEGRIDSFLP